MTLKSTPRRILVTGGAGFIGSHLVGALLERGDVVRVLDNFSAGKRSNLEAACSGRDLAQNIEVIEGDIRNFELTLTAMSGMDAVCHQAAVGSVPRSVADPVTTHQVNADGTLNVFLAARDAGVGRVIYASSSAVYGDSDRLPRREGEEGRPLSPYALTKQVNDHYGRLCAQLYGLQTIGLRYFNVYGPRQDPKSEYAAVIPRFAAALLSGDRPVIYGTGEQSRDFTYVRDVVRANFLALEAGPEACGESYNVGSGGACNLLELLGLLQDLLGTGVEPRFAPPRPGDVLHSSADPTLAMRMLGFAACHDLKQGLSESIQWYRDYLGGRVCNKNENPERGQAGGAGFSTLRSLWAGR
jgi:nucleoside-diphosphate-sugar epimerase